MSRASHNRHAEARGKKAAAAQSSDGNGQSAVAAPSPSASPAAFDAAVDAFVAGAQRDFTAASVDSTSIGKGTYHPAPADLPWRFVALGLILGTALGLVASLALR